MRKFLFAALVLAAACKNNKSKLDDMPASKVTVNAGSGSGSAAQDNWINIDSKDILDRKETAPSVFVKHVLIGWKDLEKVYGGHMDKRAGARTNAEAAKLAQEVADKLRKDPSQIDQLVKDMSEDPGAKSGDPYEVKAETQFVPEFKALALRLKEKEVGIVKTRFGYHVMERVLPPPPDPLETLDVLTRPARPGNADIQWIIIGWKDTPAQLGGQGDPRAKERTKADADKLATDVFAKVKANGDMKALMKEYSEDARTKDKGDSIPIAEKMEVPPPFENFKKAAMRLNDNEAAMVKTPMGWTIIKRIPPPPPPPPDALDSVDILKRTDVATKTRVKHILLNWKDNNGGGGSEKAKTRDRATLDKLVKDTVAKLKKGDAIEPLMKELSEDPGSGAAGTAFPVTPDAQLVEPFKNLSLRLKPGEVGIVKSQFGIHIIQRCTADDGKPADPCVQK